MSGFCGHSVFPQIYRDMKQPREYTGMVNLTYTVVAILYLLVGGVGYLMFGDFIKQEVGWGRGGERWKYIYMLRSQNSTPPLQSENII